MSLSTCRYLDDLALSTPTCTNIGSNNLCITFHIVVLVIFVFVTDDTDNDDDDIFINIIIVTCAIMKSLENNEEHTRDHMCV